MHRVRHQRTRRHRRYPPSKGQCFNDAIFVAFRHQRGHRLARVAGTPRPQEPPTGHKCSHARTGLVWTTRPPRSLGHCPELAYVAIKDVTIEARSSFDAYGGNVRNHDLVLRGTNSRAPLVVCVEAKAGEPLGATVAEQAWAAAKVKQTNPRSRGSDRLSDLVARLCRYPIEDAPRGCAALPAADRLG